MAKSELLRKDYVRGLDQLMTISCILAGFAFSGLIALPGIDLKLFRDILSVVKVDNYHQPFYYTFYSLFFSTLCFLATITTILIYRVNGYFIPLEKLRRIHIVSNVLFSLAIAALMISVIIFGVPNQTGVIIAFITGLGVAFSFIWENMSPWQRKRREEQLEKDSSFVEGSPAFSEEGDLIAPSGAESGRQGEVGPGEKKEASATEKEPVEEEKKEGE